MPYGFVSYCKGSISTNIDRFWRARGYTQFIDTHTENENLFKRIFTISLCVWKHCVPLSQTLIEKCWLSTLLGNWKKTKAQCKTPTLNHLNCALFWNQLAVFRTQSLFEWAHLFWLKIWYFQKDSKLALIGTICGNGLTCVVKIGNERLWTCWLHQSIVVIRKNSCSITHSNNVSW